MGRAEEIAATQAMPPEELAAFVTADQLKALRAMSGSRFKAFPTILRHAKLRQLRWHWRLHDLIDSNKQYPYGWRLTPLGLAVRRVLEGEL